jgi:predicted phage terminase large subunit-like protein
VDDPLNPEQAASEKELENHNRWMEQTLPTRKVDKEVTATVLVMQRLHQSDPTGRILDKKKEKVKHICLPGQIRDYEKFLNPPEMKANYIDDLLDPARLPWSALKELEEDLGQYGFAGQVGQNPAPPGGGMFKIERMAIIEALDPMDKITKTIRYWDKAGTQGDGAYTAGVKMSRLKSGKYLVHDVVRGQWSTDNRERVIRITAEADGQGVRVYLEQEPGSGGKDSVQASIRNLAGFSVEADRPTGDKVFRADPLSVQVNNGNIMLLRGEWNKSFKDEFELFPNGTYMDQVDASSGAFALLAKKKEVRIIR